MPFPFLEDLPDPGVEHASLASAALAGGFFSTSVYLGSPIFISHTHTHTHTHTSNGSSWFPPLTLSFLEAGASRLYICVDHLHVPSTVQEPGGSRSDLTD